MNYFAIVNGINSICAIIIAAIIVLKRTRKAVHLTYAFFYFLLFLWAFFYFIWGTRTDFHSSMKWLQLVEFPVCYIHVAYLHFSLQFSETFHKYSKYLILGYALSTLFIVINFYNGFFDLSYIRIKTPFHYWPHATIWLSLFIAFQVTCVLISFVILRKSIHTAHEPLRTRLKVFLTLAMIGWSGGLTNWFNFYDSTRIDPVGNPGVTFYLIGTAYLIFKHDILGLNLVVKKTFVYAVLTLFITMIYTLFIVLFEKMFQSVIGYNSIAISMLSAATIALLFNPMRLFLDKVVDKIFFGKDIEKLSYENLLLRDELGKQDRMKAVSTLAAGMAHEIKNPLTSIKTFAEYLPKKYDDPDFRDKFSRLVVDEVDRVNNIVRQLLEFSKPSEPELKVVLVCELLDETLALLNDNLLKHGIVLTKDFDRSVVIMADKNQMKQAVLNLFLNAIQSISGHGKIEVLVCLGPIGYVKISIMDTGCGMSKDQLHHAFDPFYTTKEDGSGLGLAIVHSIITKHGGKITMQSELGKGTTVNVLLKSQS